MPSAEISAVWGYTPYEREMISQRTKAALAQAKARGTRLGNPRPLDALQLANAAKAHLRSELESEREARRAAEIEAAELRGQRARL